jgi:hypothetical protein
MEENEESLGNIKKAIVSVIGEPRQLSENQREFISQYFEKAKSRHRYYYQVTILGARRPYTIEIHAFLEEKKGKSYEPIGEETNLAHKLSKDLQNKLNQSREDRNLIDDFRAF